MEIKVTINNYGTINVYQNESKEIDKGKELCKAITQSIRHCGHCTLGGNCSEHKCSMAVDLAVENLIAYIEENGEPDAYVKYVDIVKGVKYYTPSEYTKEWKKEREVK